MASVILWTKLEAADTWIQIPEFNTHLRIKWKVNHALQSKDFTAYVRYYRFVCSSQKSVKNSYLWPSVYFVVLVILKLDDSESSAVSQHLLLKTEGGMACISFICTTFFFFFFFFLLSVLTSSSLDSTAQHMDKTCPGALVCWFILYPIFLNCFCELRDLYKDPHVRTFIIVNDNEMHRMELQAWEIT